MFDIPGYSINAKLAEGGCAEIFVGTDRNTGDIVCIKRLHQKHLANRKEYKRLKREGELGLRLGQQENIVHTFKVGQDGKLPFVVLEYVKGRTVRELLVGKKQFAELDVLKMARGLAQGLGFLHTYGVCHKDVKPDNIMITEEGVVKLLDFGFAERYKAFRLFRPSLEGTLSYMAPEMFVSKRATPQTDLYGLGCTLYECAAGFQPFGGMSDNEIAKRQTNTRLDPPPLRQANAGVSVFTEKMILTALQKDPAKRFKAADEVVLDVIRNPAANGIKNWRLFRT
ncbi:MAG: serine/threonine-protein kinase [Planctomycetota bacterium]